MRKQPLNLLFSLLFLSLFQQLFVHAAKARPVEQRPRGRSDWHHEKFQQLYQASLQSDAQSVFVYWCGPTAAGYCGSTDLTDINVKSVTHAVYAFAEIQSDGAVSLQYDTPASTYNTSYLIENNIMPGVSLGGSGTPADNCLTNIDNCLDTLGATLEYYEKNDSPFYFVDSDFEQPKDAQQMQNLITFWTKFNERYPSYLITMAPECAYLWCGAASWPYNAYVSVINQLGPYGANIIYKINSQNYNNWCSNAAAGTAQFHLDVAQTFIEPCELTGYLGLQANPGIFGTGVLCANQDGDGYTPPNELSSALEKIDQIYGTSNAMCWDSLTDSQNILGKWITTDTMTSVAPPVPSLAPTSRAPSFFPSMKPSAPTESPTVKPSAPTEQPTEVPTQKAQQDSNGFVKFAQSAAGIATFSIAGAGVLAAGYFGYRCYQRRRKQQYSLISNAH